MFCKKEVLINFAKFAENTCAGDFFKKSYRPQTCNTIYWNNFLTHQRLFLLWYFHHKISKEKTVVLKNKSRHWSCSIKNLFLKTSQNLQKNTSVGVSFSINFIKNFLLKETRSLHWYYFCLPWYHELSLHRVSMFA